MELTAAPLLFAACFDSLAADDGSAQLRLGPDLEATPPIDAACFLFLAAWHRPNAGAVAKMEVV